MYDGIFFLYRRKGGEGMSIFPFINTEDNKNTAEELPLLKEYEYDFENNELLLDKNGCTYMVEKNAALRIWIMKALATERFHYTAYSFAFGTEWQDQLTGHAMDEEVLKLEMERFIVEALMVNPYILRLDNFVFTLSETGITVSFECTSIYGIDRLLLPVREVKI